MTSVPGKWTRSAMAGVCAALAIALTGCPAKPKPIPTVFHWWMGLTLPEFAPDGPPEPARAAIERLLTRSLVEEDSLGRPHLVAARRVSTSGDRLRVTFHLVPGLRFTDGSPCRAEHFREALVSGLADREHSTRLWTLRAVRGADAVRAGKPLPALGVSTPDDSTLVLDLAVPDSLLMAKLASPGASAAWAKRDSAGGWARAVGLGPYRVRVATPHQLTLLRTDGGGPDTLSIRGGWGAPRARTQLRAGTPDLVWPLPPALLEEALPPGYRIVTRGASPRRWLALVMRADVPPMTRLAARRALAHAIARGELPRRLSHGAREVSEWLPGGGRPSLPSLDQAELERWLERGKLGRSFHAFLAYDADGRGADIARSLQGDWSRYGLYLDLRPLRGRAFAREALTGQSQVLLVEAQGLTPDASGVLGPLVLPLRGPAVGAFRTGWRTREFDRWLVPSRAPAPPDPGWLERRLEEETVVLPLCELDWVWLAREGAAAVAFHPRFGPSGAGPAGNLRSAIQDR